MDSTIHLTSQARMTDEEEKRYWETIAEWERKLRKAQNVTYFWQGATMVLLILVLWLTAVLHNWIR